MAGCEHVNRADTTTDLVLGNYDISGDYFGTRNQFYGGQLGTRLLWQGERVALNVTGKLALGSTHQVVNVSGSTTEAALPGGLAPSPGTFPQGIYALGTNSGTQSKNQFTVIPSLEIKLAYQLTARLAAQVGYDIIYWNQVVRPGSQIDRNVNPTQHPVFGAGVLAGPAAPLPLFNRTDFWAQGVNFGLEYKY